MIIISIFTSFIGTLISGLLGKYIGETITKWLVTLSVFISLISVYWLYKDIMFNDIYYSYKITEWINIQNTEIDWWFTLDKLSISMLIPVVTVSCLVHLYSCSYMSHDPHQQRFFSFLSLFTFSMIILVTGNNYLILFLGWEFIGVTSYLLISFWYTRITAAKSGLSALLINRFGDAFLVIGISYLLINTGSLNYYSIFSLGSNIEYYTLLIILICFVIAATAKSAQLGLHSWLLLAMEGPTPVSSLLHAACLVIAGVFLLMRSSPLLEFNPLVLLIILWLGGLSTLLSGCIATVSNDIKRIIALSTMSQLAQEYIYIFRNQTICVKFINIINNSQITKTHNLNIYNNNNNIYLYYINNIFFNSFPIKRLLFKLKEKWKDIIISKLVGISEAIRLILIKLNNNINSFIKLFTLNSKIIKLNTKLKNSTYNLNFKGILLYSKGSLNLLRYYSIKSILDISKNKKQIENENNKFNEWLAGLIDGDGYFHLAKSGTARLQITMDLRDEEVLYLIKHKFGGNIRKIANANAYRYQLSNKKGLIKLINSINGLIRNPTRLLQMHQLCKKYDIKLIFPKPLTYNNGWFSGFIDSDGSIHVSAQKQIIIGASQKNNYLLEPLIELYGGKIYPHSSKKEAFKYVIFRKDNILNLVDNYFFKYPLKSKKRNRINLIKNIYELSKQNYTLSDEDKLIILNKWIILKNKWDKFN